MPYSIVSDAYGYVLLFFVVTFVYNVGYRYNPQWAFLPALGLALDGVSLKNSERREIYA